MSEKVSPYFSLPDVALHVPGLPVRSEEVALVVVGGEDEVWVDEVHHPLTELAIERENGHVGHGHHDLGSVQLGRLQGQVVDAVLCQSGDRDDVDIVTGRVNCLHWPEVFIKPEKLSSSSSMSNLSSHIEPEVKVSLTYWAQIFN